MAGRRILVAFCILRGVVADKARRYFRGGQATAGSVGLRRLGIGGGAVLGWVAQRSGACVLGVEGGRRKAESRAALVGLALFMLCCAVLLVPTCPLPTHSLYSPCDAALPRPTD
jgi:hypothetical protein